MAAYNSAAHIRPALDCLIAQTFSDWEVIVVDDGSTDETGAVLADYAARDRRFVYHRLADNAGTAVARNVALDLARGDWVTVLDSDDSYAPDRLAVLLERAEREALDIVADNLWLYDETADAVLGRAFVFEGSCLPLTPELLVANDGPPRIASLGHLKPFVRRSFIEKTGVRYPVEARLGEDFCFLFLLVEKTERSCLVAYTGYRYTIPFSASSGARAQGTRTAYGSDGLDDLRRTNASLARYVAEVAPRRAQLLSLMRKRGNALRDEGAWREARNHVRARRFLAAALLFARMDVSFGRDQVRAFVNRRKGNISTVLR